MSSFYPSTEKNSEEDECIITIPMIEMVEEDPFTGSTHEDPIKHITKFTHLCSTFKCYRAYPDLTKLTLFRFSLKKDASRWYNFLPETSADTWAELQRNFLEKYCPMEPCAEEEKEVQNLAETAAWLGIEENNKADEDIKNQELEDDHVEEDVDSNESNREMVTQDYMSIEEEEDIIEQFCLQFDEQPLVMIQREDIDIDVTPEDQPLHKLNDENLREEKGEDETKEKRIKDKPPNLLRDESKYEEEKWIMNDIETANGHNGDICLKLCDGFLALIDDFTKENFIVIKSNQSQSEEKMEDMHQKESSDEEESIFLEIEPQRLPEWIMQQLSFKEFLDARHLRIYLESKVDGEKGLVSTQSCEDCDSKVRSSWRRKT